MATPPYESPADVQSGYSRIGSLISGAGQKLAIGIEELQQDMQRKDFVGRVYSALKQEGFDVTPRPGETAEQAADRAAGLHLFKQTIAKFKQEDPSMLVVDPNKYANAITSFKDGYSLAQDLEKKLEGSKQKQETAGQVAGLGITPETTREQALSTVKGVPSEETLKMTAQLPTSADKEAARMKGLSAGAGAAASESKTELSREELLNQLEKEKNDEMARKEKNKIQISEKERQWKKWKKDVIEGLEQYDQTIDEQLQNEIAQLKVQDKKSAELITTYGKKMQGLREKWNQAIPEPKGIGPKPNSILKTPKKDSLGIL